MKRILIVDDDAAVRQVLRCRLEVNGYEVSEATNGVEAFAYAKNQRPDMIVLDVMMPVMDGYTFINELKWEEEIRDIPIVVLSGRTQIRDIFCGIKHVQYLPKPFESSELLHVVDTCVGK